MPYATTYEELEELPYRAVHDQTERKMPEINADYFSNESKALREKYQDENEDNLPF